ncbi:GNAT family N-acetyltransferase [Rhodocytophaga aerolata]|uniref:GNAT family N-acetyltransferase n=1 Tax=Rhodocytophaga aerolata TaxID=455078 RepID=A0ABT8R7P9_9BACT|nr:GNAT family N-acetyltransferase [Rhodocytophaga aerolata]MDO1447278.1 GNAT family N-acetyltransferase [Rhodocytophaga aerolata]
MQIFSETDRLTLRELLPTDALGMYELDADPEVHTYLGNKPVKSIEESRQIIEFIREQYVSNGIGRWAVIEKESQEFIGWAGLKFIRDTINRHTYYYDLGYRFIKRYWGKGYATEAAKASLAFGFNNLQLKEIYAMAHLANQASQQVLTKVGMQFIETFTYEEEQMNWYKMTNPLFF